MPASSDHSTPCEQSCFKNESRAADYEVLGNKFVAGNIVLIDAIKLEPLRRCDRNISPSFVFPHRCLPESRNHPLKRYFRMRCVPFIAIWGFPDDAGSLNTLLEVGYFLQNLQQSTHICAPCRTHRRWASKENNLEPNTFPSGDSFSSQYLRKSKVVYSIMSTFGPLQELHNCILVI